MSAHDFRQKMIAGGVRTIDELSVLSKVENLPQLVVEDDAEWTVWP